MENPKLKAPRFKSYAIWLFFIFVAAALIAGNLLWLNLVLTDSAENVSKIQMAVAFQAREVVKNFIEQLSGDILQKTADFLAGEDEEKINKVLTGLADSDEAYFARLILYDKEGKETLKIHRAEAKYLQETFKDVAPEGISHALDGKRWIGKVEFLGGFGPVLSVAVPIRSAQGIDGVLAGDVNLKVLAGRLKDFKPGKSGQTYVVDQAGRIISHSNYFLVISGSDWLSRPIVQKIVQNRETVDGLNADDRYFNDAGLEVQAAGLPVPEFGWGVVVEQPFFEIQTSSNQILTFGLISLGIGLVLIIVLNINFLALGRTSAALEKERDRISAIVSNLTDGLIQYDPDFRIQLMNPRAEEMLGIKEDEVKDKIVTRDFDIVTRNAKFKALASVIFAEPGDDKEKKGAFKEKYPLVEVVLKEPQERWLKIATVPIADYQGKTAGFIKVIHDVSRERVVARMKSEFISIVAHQLRTPLAAIKWTLRMILDGDVGQITSEQKTFLEQGYASNDRMIFLINDLLNVARIEEGRFGYEFVETDLIALIEKNVANFQLAARSKNISLIFEKPAVETHRVTIDSSKIDLVFQNLIDNAIKYSLPGGRIELKAEPYKDRPFLLVSIKDSGIGIPSHQVPRVFTKFFRGDNVIRFQTEGTGLGMFIVKNIVRRHGGDIWVESEEGKGTTFSFTLPLDAKMIPAIESPFEELIA
ncbi:hypothetical protein A2W39_02980 [Candidatus Azambacteria bacterium RIFCSPHIGHO2_01_46_10]|uniref:histidine kinase n=4 Tax=Candidatus Azamiibacteriota TaxID=1752741 RepID=A0A1F5BZI0_9BACT|nr:MAG: hypothetical protein A2W60_00330 [Candidatus Azambacteria bacterium RIFCSPHIGHO2_02_46_12]OGD36012.1 MAG: hypothetical protein A2W39_02980 [Candidatus Azambacteria bacterium RIFCSPHIGHO2_01_46_10]OGD44055.1 MAG: hypothetical protein A3J02_02855 [Candidatus Azambacteria bacterium RIFCSPLOWO2_02_FULL_46_11]